MNNLDQAIIQHDSGSCDSSWQACDCTSAKELRLAKEAGSIEIPEQPRLTDDDSKVTPDQFAIFSNTEVEEIKDLTIEQKLERYYERGKYLKAGKIKQQALFGSIQQDKFKLTEKQLEKLKEYEKKYKPESPSPNERQRENLKKEKEFSKALEALGSLGIDTEKIKAMMAAKKRKATFKPDKPPTERKSASERAMESAAKVLGQDKRIDLEAFKEKLKALAAAKLAKEQGNK